MTTTKNAGDSLSVRLEHHARDIEKDAWPDLRSLPGLLREAREAIQAGEALASTPSRVIPLADELDKLAAQIRCGPPVMTDAAVRLLINAASVLRGMVMIHEHREDEVKRVHERQALLDAEDPGVVAKRVATELRDATVATPFLDAKLRVTMESAATLLEMQGRIIQRGREPAPEPDWPPQKPGNRILFLVGIRAVKCDNGNVELWVKEAHRMVLTTLTETTAEILGAFLAPRPQPVPAQPLADKHLEELRAYLDQDSVLRQERAPDLRAYSFEPALWRALRDHLNSHMEVGYSPPDVITSDWVHGWAMHAINASTRDAMLRIAGRILYLENRAEEFERQTAPEITDPDVARFLEDLDRNVHLSTAPEDHFQTYAFKVRIWRKVLAFLKAHGNPPSEAPGIADSKPGDLDDIAEFLMAFARDEARLGAEGIARKMRAAALHIQDLEKRLRPVTHAVVGARLSFADGVAAVADAIQHPESDHPEMNTPGDAVRLAAWIRENVRAPGGPEVDPDFLEADQTVAQDGLSQRVEEGPAGPVFATVETEGAGMMLTTDAWVEKLHDLADRRASLTGTDRDLLRRAAGHMRDLDRAAAPAGTGSPDWHAEAWRLYGYSLGSQANKDAVAVALRCVGDWLNKGEDIGWVVGTKAWVDSLIQPAGSPSPSGSDWEAMTWRESVEKLADARANLARLEVLERSKVGRSGTFQDGVEACAKAVRRKEMPFPAAPHTRSQLSDWLLDTVKAEEMRRTHPEAKARTRQDALAMAKAMRDMASDPASDLSGRDIETLDAAAQSLEDVWA